MSYVEIAVKMVRYLSYEEKTVKEISRYLKLDKSTTRKYLLWLEKKGLIKRIDDFPIKYYSIAEVKEIRKIIESGKSPYYY